MNAVAVVYVNHHLESIAVDRRIVPQLPKRSLRERLASILDTVRSTAAEPGVAPSTVLPSVH